MSDVVHTPFGAPGFLILAGSRLYGIDVPSSDYDYTGALVEPVGYRIGLLRHKEAKGDTQNGFEQCQFKGDNSEGTVYSLWKLARMFAEGNPTILCLMYGTPLVDEYGICTEEFQSIVRSRQAGVRFIKYMQAQRRSMIGQRSRHVTRLTLIEDHGFDTKFAGHVIRLGYQGIEYLDTGQVTLPMPPEERQIVQSIRAGSWSLDQVVSLSETLEERMTKALDGTSLPERPDHERLSEWVVDRYKKSWFAS